MVLDLHCYGFGDCPLISLFTHHHHATHTKHAKHRHQTPNTDKTHRHRHMQRDTTDD